MYFVPSPQPLDSATDARYTHKGKYSGWLIKAKSDGAKAKWFQTTGRRYFTIDFDRQIFFYAQGESASSQVSTPIMFRDILNACAGHSYEADDLGTKQGSGIVRTVAGVMNKPRSTIPGHYPFMVRTVGKRLRLEAEVEKEAFDWIQMLNAASRKGKDVDIFSGCMETCEKATVLRPATPDSSTASTGSGGGNTLSETSGQQSTIGDGEDHRSESLASPKTFSQPSGIKFAQRPLRFPAWEASAASEEQSRICTEKESHALSQQSSNALPQQSAGTFTGAYLSGYLGRSEASSLDEASTQQDERIPSKELSARDFGFEEEDLEADTAASVEASPVASPKMEFRSAFRRHEVEQETQNVEGGQLDITKSDESDDDIVIGVGQTAIMDASRVAADIMLLQRHCAVAKTKKVRPAKKNAAKDRSDIGGEQDQEARVAADLMLLQTAAKKSVLRSSSRVRARNIVAE